MNEVFVDQAKENSGENDYERYLEDLQLSQDDLHKTILGVGSGESYFAKWAKKKNKNPNIFSLEPEIKTQEKELSVRGKAGAIPFQDDSFDLVISNCFIPNIFLGENLENVKKDVRASLFEMMRVTKPGGEIRLGRVLRGDRYETQKNLAIALNETLEELKQIFRVRIEQINFPEKDLHEWEGGKQTDRLLAKVYLIKIHKPNARN